MKNFYDPFARLLSSSFLLVVGLSCNNSDRSNHPLWTTNLDTVMITNSYTLIPVFDGIYIESFDSAVLDPDRYNKNNKIFTENSIFEFAYKYVDDANGEYLVEFLDEDWQLVPLKTSGVGTIRTFILSVPKSLNHPNYPQTNINYHYPPNRKFSSTGVIENEKNIWLHPPRDGLFKILQLNPFPYVKEPLLVGDKWSWSMKIGSQWSDKRWKEWHGVITNNCEYEVVAKKRINTPFGILLCFEIFSQAESEVGKTFLTTYFNRDYGFVKLLYTNIDQSRIEIDLIRKE